MKIKTGFTLAEVLITLAIIGVVATLTLPSLMTNTAEQQALTAFKKIMNTLNETGQMNAALEGFDYSSATNFGTIADSIRDGQQTIGAMLNERLQVSAQASGNAWTNCGTPFVLRDGTAICLNAAGGRFGGGAAGGFSTILVDTNGAKGPNMISTCVADGCQNRAERHIFDQFRVTLYQGIAVPGWWTAVDTEGNNPADFAARYAMGIGRRR